MRSALLFLSLERGKFFSLAFSTPFCLSYRHEGSKTHRAVVGRGEEKRGEERGGQGTKVLQQVLQLTGRESLSKMSDQSDNARQRAGKQIMSRKREK